MTQAEFNEMLRISIASASIGGYYTSRWSGEELDELAGGRSLVIKGVYASLAALQAAFPNGADGAYQIASTKDLYIWNPVTKSWQNIGQLQGPAGPRGVTFTPVITEDGVLMWLNDGGLENPPQVKIRGDDGIGITSIRKVSGTGAPGTTDVYAIYLTNGTSYRFSVYQGAGAAADVPAVLKAAADALAAQRAAEASKDTAAEKAEAASASAETAKRYSGKPPIIQGDAQTWWTWNDGQGGYVDTEKPSRGLNGVALSAEGQYAFNVSADGDLILSYTGDETPGFRINRDDGCLYLEIA